LFKLVLKIKLFSEYFLGGKGYILDTDVAEFIPFKETQLIRKTLVERAPRLLGFIYFWGGR
jgi:hypothetical protein